MGASVSGVEPLGDASCPSPSATGAFIAGFCWQPLSEGMMIDAGRMRSEENLYRTFFVLIHAHSPFSPEPTTGDGCESVTRQPAKGFTPRGTARAVRLSVKGVKFVKVACFHVSISEIVESVLQ
jgi:hypothetical protein